MIHYLRKITMRLFSVTLMKYIKTADTVLCTNGLNSFDGCPKEIFVEAQKYSELGKKYYWVTKNKKEYELVRKKYKNVIYSFSLKGILYIIKSKKYILNVGTQDFYPGLKIPNNRIIIQTFHGFPTKTFCKSANDFYTQKQIEKQLEDSYNKNNMYILTAGTYEDNAFKMNCDFPEDRLLKIGHPRNDKLENWKNNVNILNKKDKKLIFYCPTWRENNDFKFLPFNDKNLNEFNLFLKKNKMYFIVKLHPLYGNMDCDLSKYSNIIIYSKEWNLNNNDMFSVADLLITDYSSIYCDYLLTNKPVAFIQYDYKEYIKTRPLSNKREVLFPGPFINSFNELMFEISKLLEDEEYYKTEREKALTLFYEWYKFDASKKVIDFLEKIGD